MGSPGRSAGFICVWALLLFLSGPANALPLRARLHRDVELADDKFAIMMDAGSSGTRVHVYGWPSTSDCASRLAKQLVVEIGQGEQITPGLSFLAPGNISGVPAYLAPLVEFAQSVVPEAVQATTPIYLQATAGMRLLPEDQQTALLEAVRDVFKGSPFEARPEETSVISGSAEGANEWTSVNYLRGALGHSPSTVSVREAPAGVLGMGGASTQIAFKPLEGTDLKAGAFPIAFEGVEPIELYVHSFLGLGATEAQDSLQRYLAAPDQVQARQVTDPCLLVDYSVSRPVGPGGEEVLLEGGGDAEGCKAAIRRSLINTEAPCPLPPCSFDGVYQPDLTEGGLVLKKSFFQISAFFFTAEFFGLPETATLRQLEDAGKEFCALDWLAAQMAYPNTPPQFLANYCFSSMYFTVLLHHGYGIDKTRTPLHWAEAINGVGLDWPLGATLRATCDEKDF
jgi:Golgi nucleoside diphosphatase